MPSDLRRQLVAWKVLAADYETPSYRHSFRGSSSCIMQLIYRHALSYGSSYCKAHTPFATSLRSTTGLLLRRAFAERAGPQALSPQVPAVPPFQQNTNTTPAPQPSRQGPKQDQGGPHLLILFLGIAASPVLMYYYWNYRDAHMKAKKEAMLKEIQARAKAG